MRSWISLLCTSLLLLAVLGCRSSGVGGDGLLPEGASALIPLPSGDPFPDVREDWEQRADVLESLALSLKWTHREHAVQFFPASGITHERAIASLERMQELLETSTNAETFQRAVEEQFQGYLAAGLDGRSGDVLFTAYCTPVLPGSRVRTPLYRHALYRLPPDLKKRKDGSVEGWESSVGLLPTYPSRAALERGRMLEGKGLELVWLSDPIDAFLAHVNGSAFIRLEDGSMFKAGYAGKNGRPYVSLGKELIEANVFEPGKANLASIRDWSARTDEATRDEFLQRNQSYVFFTEIDSNPHGSLDFPVRAGRSVATDKTMFPRGAIVYVETELAPDSVSPPVPYKRMMFDQDTGGAIRNAGRADLYLGIGDEAEARAGRMKNHGRMVYLFLREDA